MTRLMLSTDKCQAFLDNVVAVWGTRSMEWRRNRLLDGQAGEKQHAAV